ncbi:RagB/SusD family nutrient uptake outer membrane protein [Chitinophaga pinensis]|uniref:RagB/SusD domain protein n=1 Tax=Chitinophaga pinensis (strain ATCC 43595 / DSM 2588 / LMG 13176 / NBRC 15968 / NCIMB 11800 / UQM 2034) TaxID=485918 RepID=A0A979G4F7_CHIPD|nr:RagB/SusD family nutrient uptake outer membrane protein [Chitinophaga pinensis]ACU60632.1 RagB/SusD domain protein [Chitinophaga pinensis DSM 2588]
MYNFRYNIVALSFLILLSLTSCDKFLDIAPPEDKYVSSEIYNNENTANSAVLGIYEEMIRINSGIISRAITLNCGMASDELSNFSPLTNVFLNNNIPTDNNDINNYWSFLYSYVYSANAAIEGLDASNGLPEALKKQLAGEARFLRAFTYFYLVNIWGPVPLATTTKYQDNQNLPRAAVTDIYKQIVIDLKEAATLLPVGYNSEKIRADSYAAHALLARVYLYMQDWVNAEDEASKVIEPEIFSPLPTTSTAFLNNSKETIFQFKPVNPNNNTWVGASFIPSTSTVLYPVSTRLLSDFEAGDERRINWVGSVMSNGNPSYYPYKYKIRSGGNPLNEYYIVLRLAEQYLIRAEARANNNDVEGARSDVNVVRSRAKLPDLPVGINKEQCLAAIMHERQIELFAEWGHRWFDLKRTGQADNVLKPLKGQNWQTTDQLWPIPALQIKANPALKQNLGYQ